MIRRRGAIGTSAALSVLVAIIGIAVAHLPRSRGVTPHASSSAQGSYSVSVSASPETGPLSSNFLGLALEYNTVPDWVGSTRTPINPPLVQLIHNLDPSGHPLIRIGGQSTDRSWWPVKGLKQPIGVTYVLGSGWTADARALARAVNGQLMLGLNLEANRTRIPQQEAEQFLSGIGQQYIASFQLGNEPELYRYTPWYRVVNRRPIPWYSKVGERMFSRAPGYDPADFGSEFSRMASLLPRSVPLAGPETGNPDFMQQFSGLLGPGSRVQMLTLHAYGTNGCYKDPINIGYPTIPHQLNVVASRELLQGFEQFPAIAHRHGATFRIDEMGSVTCNGRAGVSDTMASALWALDALFSVAQSGVDGVNLHSYPGSVNGLFDFTYSKGTWHAVVHPLYYGALMFAQAAPAGSRLLHVATGSLDQIRTWATMGADHRVRVLLVNDGTSGSTNVVVHSPAGYGSKPATIERLRAPSVGSKTGITLGGQQFGDTTTGVLPAPLTENASPSSGAYTVPLPAGSAALVTLAPR